MTCSRLFLASVISAALAAVCSSYSAAGEQLPLTLYTTSDGLVSDRVQCILSDSHGFLWIGTEDGISRFDGVEFTNLTASDLPGADVRAIVEGHDGTYWAATDRGLAHWNPALPSASSTSPATVVHVPGGALADEVRAVLEDHSGTLWVGTAGGLFRLDRGRGSSWRIAAASFDSGTAPRSVRINSLLEDRERNIWAAATSGLYRRVSEGAFRRMGAAAGSPTDVRSLLETRDGSLWVGQYAGLLELGPDRGDGRPLARRFGRETGIAGDHVAALIEAFDGEIWAGCFGGLSEVSPQGLSAHTYTSAQGLAGTLVTAVAEDRDGNLWIGTDGAGLLKLERAGPRRFDAADGLRSTRIASLFEDRDGRPCAFTRGTRPEQIAADESFVECFDGVRFRSARLRIAPGARFGWGWSQVVLQDRWGDWWVPTQSGLYRFPPVQLEALESAAPRRVYTTRDGLPSNLIYRLFEDRRGDLWIGMLDGRRSVARWDRATDSLSLPEVEPPTPGEPMAFADDKAGAVWIGFSSGFLERHTGQVTTVFGETNGLPSGRIQALHVDQEGRLWVAGSRGGISRADRPGDPKPRFLAIGSPQTLASSNVLTLVEDHWGRIYAGTARGLDRLDPSGAAVRHLTTRDGLAPGVVESVLEDRDGDLWFGSVQGLSRLQPGADRPPWPASARITRIRTHGDLRPIPQLGSAEVRLPAFGPEGMPLEIGFAAVDFGPRGQARYQFLLEGVDPDWRPTDQRSVVYGRLAPGNYRFRVRRFAGPSAAGPPAEVRFRVLAPPWRRPESVVVGALAIGILLYAWHRSRLRAALAVERVRMGVAADLHDDIGAGLSEIAILSELVRRPEGRSESARLLEEIGEGARRLVDSMSDIVWSTDPRKDDIESLVQRIRRFAVNTLESQGIAWSLEVGEGLEARPLDPDRRRQIFLIVKEALTNVARHAACTHASLRLSRVDGEIAVEIEDDGRGFDSSVGPPAGGQGLSSMRARAASLGGTFEIGPRPSGGTRVIARLPLTGPAARRAAW